MTEGKLLETAIVNFSSDVWSFFFYLLEQLQQLQLDLHYSYKNSLGSTYLRITIYTLHPTNLQYAVWSLVNIDKRQPSLHTNSAGALSSWK